MNRSSKTADHPAIVYKRSYFARLARFLLPNLQKVLPCRTYELLYDFLRNAYKKSLRFFYFPRVLTARLFGDPDEAVKRV
jgi:hypothetical protein